MGEVGRNGDVGGKKVAAGPEAIGCLIRDVRVDNCNGDEPFAGVKGLNAQSWCGLADTGSDESAVLDFATTVGEPDVVPGGQPGEKVGCDMELSDALFDDFERVG